MFSDPGQGRFSALGKVHVSNVLNALLWQMGLMVLLLGSAFACNAKDEFIWFVLYLFAGSFGVTSVMYVFFAVRAPDRLQSEQHQFHLEALQAVRGRDLAPQPVSGEVGPNPIVIEAEGEQ